MIRYIRVALVLFNTPRLIPHIFALLWFDWKGLVRADLLRWVEVMAGRRPASAGALIWAFFELMVFKPEYRNVFYLRFGRKSRLISWLCPGLSSLQIQPGDIGPGLFIQHGLCTLISAERIGANCWINQQVTIGYSNRTDRPIIGDNVRIAAGAKIIGKVRIGDHVVVGANTVVIDDVPSNTTAFGVPAMIMGSTKLRRRERGELSALMASGENPRTT